MITGQVTDPARFESSVISVISVITVVGEGGPALKRASLPLITAWTPRLISMTDYSDYSDYKMRKSRTSSRLPVISDLRFRHHYPVSDYKNHYRRPLTYKCSSR